MPKVHQMSANISNNTYNNTISAGTRGLSSGSRQKLSVYLKSIPKTLNELIASCVVQGLGMHIDSVNVISPKGLSSCKVLKKTEKIIETNQTTI